MTLALNGPHSWYAIKQRNRTEHKEFLHSGVLNSPMPEIVPGILARAQIPGGGSAEDEFIFILIFSALLYLPTPPHKVNF